MVEKPLEFLKQFVWYESARIEPHKPRTAHSSSCASLVRISISAARRYLQVQGTAVLGRQVP